MSEETISQTDDQDFEEISSDEVDRVVEVLDRLIEDVNSDNIKHYLEEASSNIYYLVYEDSEEELEADADDAEMMTDDMEMDDDIQEAA